jgi:hypothetical protein
MGTSEATTASESSRTLDSGHVSCSYRDAHSEKTALGKSGLVAVERRDVLMDNRYWLYGRRNTSTVYAQGN